MKRFYDLNKEEDVELLRQLALASDEEDGDDVFSESEEGEFEEAEAELEETSQDPLPGPSNSRSCTYQSRGEKSVVSSDSEESEIENEDPPVIARDWSRNGQERAPFDFLQQAGVAEDIRVLTHPIDIFEYFFDDHLANLIAQETNRYAEQKILEKTRRGKMTPRSRDRSWEDTSFQEIKLLIGLIFLQGIVQKPKCFSLERGLFRPRYSTNS